MSEISLKLLIVDDEPNIRNGLSKGLQGEADFVEVAGDGLDAMAKFEQSRHEVVITDLRLPGDLDGLQVCRAIRENAAWNAVRVVMLTAKGRELDRRKGMEMGADDYVIKPFATQDILDCIARHLQTSGDPDSRSGEWDAEGA